MTFAEALNILQKADFYAQHNLARPSFYDLPDGKLGVSFSSARADGNLWGYARFDSMEKLTAFVAGRNAAKAEADCDAKAAEQAATKAGE